MMRFILGLLIGVGIGFAGSVLFAPQQEEAPGSRRSQVSANGAGGFQSALDGLRKQFDEAFSEAKKAQREAEEEMTERYRRVVGRSGK